MQVSYQSEICPLTWTYFQFAGGFDAESMKAFEELRSRVRSQMGEENKMEGS